MSKYQSISINLSGDRILESVYALAAMRRYDRSESHCVEPVFGRDNEEALRRIVTSAAVNLVAHLHPFVTSMCVEGDVRKIITLKVPFGAEFAGLTPTRLLEMLENAVVLGTLELATDGNEATQWGRLAMEAAAALRLPLDSPRGVSLAAGWY